MWEFEFLCVTAGWVKCCRSCGPDVVLCLWSGWVATCFHELNEHFQRYVHLSHRKCITHTKRLSSAAFCIVNPLNQIICGHVQLTCLLAETCLQMPCEYVFKRKLLKSNKYRISSNVSCYVYVVLVLDRYVHIYIYMSSWVNTYIHTYIHTYTV